MYNDNDCEYGYVYDTDEYNDDDDCNCNDGYYDDDNDNGVRMKLYNAQVSVCTVEMDSKNEVTFPIKRVLLFMFNDVLFSELLSLENTCFSKH